MDLLCISTCSLSTVMKCGMSCSLFEVVEGKGKPTCGSLAALVNKLERDRMVSQPVAVTYQMLKCITVKLVCQRNILPLSEE